jgi:hypothetical protein
VRPSFLSSNAYVGYALPDAYRDCLLDAQPDAHSHVDTDGHVHAHGYRHADFDCHTDFDRHSDRYGPHRITDRHHDP